MALFSTFLYGSGPLYTGPGPAPFTGSSVDKLLSLDFYRTDTDNLYVFHWGFNQAFVSPALFGLDYQLQLDTDPNFLSPVTYETITEPTTVMASGYSISGAYASINIAAGETLDISVDDDGVQTIILALNTTGATIAADIEAKVQALIANDPVNQPAFNNFAATFNGTLNQYTLVSGSVGIDSTVVISGGTAASQLLLGLAEGGFEVRGNSAILNQPAQRVLIVENSLGVVFIDVSATSNAPGPNQFIVSLATNQVTFNDANVPDTITIIYVSTSSGDIIQFQRGNVRKGFTVPIFTRVDSERLTFYGRVRIKSGLTFGPFSDVLEARTLADVTKESADRLLQVLPDRHVYPIDEVFKPLADRRSNISKIFWGEGVELDRFFLEKENAIRDPRQSRTRDPRLFDIIGSRFGYPKPSAMEFVDYREVVSSLKEAALNGGTFSAAKLIGAAFTGVDPTITLLSQNLNFITASETDSIETVVVPLSPPYAASLAAAVRNDPIIPGSSFSGPITSVAEALVIPSVPGPYTLTLASRPANIPNISGFTYTNDAPAPSEFAVDYATGTLTFNSADAGTPVTITYLPNPDVTAGTISINVDGDGVQVITLDGPFESKIAVAENIQEKVKELVAVTLSNQPALDNFRAEYHAELDQFVLISGNLNPTAASSVVVSAGSAAVALKLRAVDGAVETTGLAYQTPPGPAAAGFFITDIDTSDGSLLTFEGVAEAGNTHTVIYKKKSTVYSYLPNTTTAALVIPLVSPYTVTLATLSANIPEVTGFTYVEEPPAAGEFTVDFSTGVLTFNSADAGAAISVLYVSVVPMPPTLLSTIEAGFGVKIILNNPGTFLLDRDNISFLLKQILPAHIKFILI